MDGAKLQILRKIILNDGKKGSVCRPSRKSLAGVFVAPPAPLGVAQRLAVIDMAAIAKGAAVAEAVARDDGAGMIHERNGQPPAALIEIASSSGIVPGVGNVAAMSEAADVPRLVAIRNEIGDERLKPSGEVARNGDISSRG